MVVSCKLGYGSKCSFLVEDYSFENAIEQLINITTRLGYVDYNYSNKELENFKFL